MKNLTNENCDKCNSTKITVEHVIPEEKLTDIINDSLQQED